MRTETTIETREFLNTKSSFDKVIEQAMEIQKKCKDEIFTAAELKMDDNLQIKGMDLSPLATGHLCGKLQVPSRYFNRLVDAHQNALAAENINVWLNDDKRKLMLREYDGHIRGVLSGSYSKYDAPEILETFKEVYGSDRFKLKGSYINEERLHLRLVENEILPIDGEDLFAGITLDSSDVGRSGLVVRFFIYKQVCTNGLVVAKSSAKIFTQKHIGITHEDFKDSLVESLLKFDEIKSDVVAMIEATHKIPMKDDLEEIAKQIKDATKLSDNDVEEVINLAVNKYEATTWGIINGITEVAQKFSLERRLELETLAGNMLAS